MGGFLCLVQFMPSCIYRTYEARESMVASRLGARLEISASRSIQESKQSSNGPWWGVGVYHRLPRVIVANRGMPGKRTGLIDNRCKTNSFAHIKSGSLRQTESTGNRNNSKMCRGSVGNLSSPEDDDFSEQISTDGRGGSYFRLVFEKARSISSPVKYLEQLKRLRLSQGNVRNALVKGAFERRKRKDHRVDGHVQSSRRSALQLGERQAALFIPFVCSHISVRNRWEARSHG